MAAKNIGSTLWRSNAITVFTPFSGVKSALSIIGKKFIGLTDYANPIVRMVGIPKPYFVGVGLVSGTTKIKALPVDLPVSRPVSLYDAEGNLVAKTQSGLDGAYIFAGLRPGVPYFVVAFDTTNAYRAVVADRVNPT